MVTEIRWVFFFFKKLDNVLCSEYSTKPYSKIIKKSDALEVISFF